MPAGTGTPHPVEPAVPAGTATLCDRARRHSHSASVEPSVPAGTACDRHPVFCRTSRAHRHSRFSIQIHNATLNSRHASCHRPSTCLFATASRIARLILATIHSNNPGGQATNHTISNGCAPRKGSNICTKPPDYLKQKDILLTRCQNILLLSLNSFMPQSVSAPAAAAALADASACPLSVGNIV